MFYKSTKQNKFVKIVPDNIVDLMNPIVLAYLIQGDGNFDKGRNRVRIYTNSFNKLEVENLAEILRKNYNLKTSIIKTGALNQYNLYISKTSMKDLVEIIKPYLQTSMYYKLNGYI